MRSNDYDAIIVGAGWAGAICARGLAEKGMNVLVLDRRDHIGGNMYDYWDEHGLLIHKYGPHIMMTDNSEIVEEIKKYDDLYDISVLMEAYVDDKAVPLPINFNSINLLYGTNIGHRIIDTLRANYHDEEVSIFELINSKIELIRDFAEEIFNKVFLGYNQKMWGGNDLDLSVINRVPIRLSYNNIRSKKTYNFVPAHGYTELFREIFDHDGISVRLGVNATDVIKIEDDKIIIDGKTIFLPIIYTAPIDELFSYEYGPLGYRAIQFETEYVTKNSKFDGLALTYPMSGDKIRTSDMSRVTGVKKDNLTALVHEYSGTYDISSDRFCYPSYPVINSANTARYMKYKSRSESINNLYLLGRLAEYRYYDMAQVIEQAWSLLQREF